MQHSRVLTLRQRHREKRTQVQMSGIVTEPEPPG
jgi:hypothetical protein